MKVLLVLLIPLVWFLIVIGGKSLDERNHFRTGLLAHSSFRGRRVSATASARGYDGAITLDPVSVISLLALGAFLINNILQLLRSHQIISNTGRSLHPADVDIPLDLSDVPSEQYIGSSRVMSEWDGKLKGDFRKDPRNYKKILRKIGSIFHLNLSRTNNCMKEVICDYKVRMQQRRENGSLKSSLFDTLLLRITKIMAPELISFEEKFQDCRKFSRLCSDSGGRKVFQ